MKQVNELPVYEEDDACSLDEYSEEMAQKVHNKIEESKYNDANIKKDIAELKKEQEEQNENMTDLEKYNTNQDKLITKLQEENNKLKKALINVEIEESKSIHIEDANQMGSLEVLGNHVQEIREGYNLLNLGTFNQKTSNGMTCTQVNNSSVKFNGTTSAITNFWFNDLGIALSAGTYKFKLNESISGIAYALKDADGANILQTALNEETITLAEEKTFNQLLIQVNENMNLTNKEINLMIYKGIEKKPYEQYGASPSPDYPSEAKCLGSNKNIFDEVLLTGYGYNQSTGLKMQNVSTYCNDNIIEVNTNNVTFSQNGEAKLGRFFCYDINKTFLGSVVGTGTIELLENTRFINFQTTKETLNYNPVNVKIEEETEATSYSSYGQGSTEIRKINKNLLKLKNVSKIEADAGEYEIKDNILYINGTFSSVKNLFFELENGIELKGNYTIKNHYEKLTDINLNISLRDEKNSDNYVLSFNNRAYNQKTEQDLNFTVKYLYVQLSIGTYNDFEVKLQLEKGTTATDYAEHQETDYLLYIQQEMLKGDYFVKEDDVWREVHNWNKLILKGTEYINISSLKDTRMVLLISNAKQDTEEILAVSNSFLGITYNEQQSNNLTNVIAVNNSYLSVDTENITSTSDFKALLQEKYNAGNPVYVYYKTATPTKLACTEEQTAVLEELNNLNLFEGVNNIITAEDIALLKLKYVADTKMYLENYINSKIAESEG